MSLTTNKWILQMFANYSGEIRIVFNIFSFLCWCENEIDKILQQIGLSNDGTNIFRYLSAFSHINIPEHWVPNAENLLIHMYPVLNFGGWMVWALTFTMLFACITLLISFYLIRLMRIFRFYSTIFLFMLSSHRTHVNRQPLTVHIMFFYEFLRSTTLLVFCLFVWTEQSTAQKASEFRWMSGRRGNEKKCNGESTLDIEYWTRIARTMKPRMKE